MHHDPDHEQYHLGGVFVQNMHHYQFSVGMSYFQEDTEYLVHSGVTIVNGRGSFESHSVVSLCKKSICISKSTQSMMRLFF